MTTECAIMLHNQLLWRSWQRVGLIIPRSPVRSWSGAYKCLYSSVWQSMRLVSARSRVRSSLEAVRVGVVGNISACHADAPGSIPGRGDFFFLSLLQILEPLNNVVCIFFFQQFWKWIQNCELSLSDRGY